MLAGRPAFLKEKKEVPFDMFKPLHIPDSLIEFRAIFQKEVPGLYQSGAVIDGIDDKGIKVRRFFCFNLLVKDLMWKAYRMPGLNINDDFVEVHTVDSAKFFWPGEGKNPETYTGISRADWGEKNQYSYELRIPEYVDDSLFYNHVITDLELNLGIHTYRSLRQKTVCYVMYNSDSVTIRPALADEKLYLGIVGSRLIIRNVKMSQLINWLARQAFGAEGRPARKEPYIDKTGVDYPITAIVDLGDDPWYYLSFEHLERCLEEQLGLRFEIARDDYPVLVIEDL